MLPAYRFGEPLAFSSRTSLCRGQHARFVPIGFVLFGNCPPEAVAGLRRSPMTGAKFIGRRL